MGVWIETAQILIRLIQTSVTPYMGVWIETVLLTGNGYAYIGHTLYGCVDWNSSLV